MIVRNRFNGNEIGKFDIASGAYLRDANLRNADLCNANLRNANLCGANLCGADLRSADLCNANLRGAYLCGANLCGADLCGANLRNANLCGAYLCGADLCGADLCGANLRNANLCGAYLSDANLYGADLCGANLRNANLPSPTMMLLAHWEIVSDNLCAALMHYDAENHPDPSKFDDWINGGHCPYNDIKIQRCANFTERRKLWKPLSESKRYTAYQLMTMLLKEKCVWEE